MNTHYDRLLFVGKVKIPSKQQKMGNKNSKTRLLVMTYSSSSLFRDNGASALRFAFHRQSSHGKALSLLGSALDPNETPECHFPLGQNLIVHKIDQMDPAIDQYLSKLSLNRIDQEVVYLLQYVHQSHIFPIVLANKSAGQDFHAAIISQQICERKYQQIAPNLSFIRCITHGAATGSFQIDPNFLSQKEEEQMKIWADTIRQCADNQTIEIILKFRLVDKVSNAYFNKIVPTHILESSIYSLQMQRCSITDRSLHDFFIPLSEDQKQVFFPLKLQQLKHLNLSANQLTDYCFQTLSKLISGTPNLRSLDLSKNKIKLSHQISQKLQKNVSRFSVSPHHSPYKQSQISRGLRLSSSSSQLHEGASQSIIMFLHSLEHKIDLFLHQNLIKDPSIICDYLIEAFNVPLRYLSLGKNKFLSVDVIKMAKIQMRVIQQRSTTKQQYCLVDIGPVQVIDFEVQQYVQLVRDLQVKWGLKEKRNQRVVRISGNPQWEICNEVGVFQDLDLSKKTTSPIRAKNRSRLLSMASNAISQSSPSLNEQEDTEVNEGNLHQVMEKLRIAYSQQNYSGVRVYKQMLKQYNEQVFESKIKSLYSTDDKKIKRQQQEIVAIIRDIVNYEGYGSEVDYNRKLDVVISKMFRKRIDYTRQAGFSSLSDQLLEEGMFGDVSWNCLLFLLYLKQKRDQKIQQLLSSRYDPIHDFSSRAFTSSNIYEHYFITQLDAHTHDDFAYILHHARSNSNSGLSPTQYDRIQPPLPQGIPNYKLRSLNQALKKRFLTHSFLSSYISGQEQYMAMLDPKMQPLRYLLHSPLNNNKDVIKVNIPYKVPNKPKSIIGDVDNMLDYISKNDVIKNYPFNPQAKEEGAMLYKGPKYCDFGNLSKEEQQQMRTYCGNVINFLIFLYHSPDQVMAQTIQYLHFLLGFALQAKTQSLRIALGDQFYLQLLTMPQKKLANGILCSIVQFSSLYLQYSASIEPFIISHLLKYQAHPIEEIRLLHHNEDKFRSRQNLLSKQTIQSLFKFPLHAQPIHILSKKIGVYAMQNSNYEHNINEFYLQKIQIDVHLLQPVSSILSKAITKHFNQNCQVAKYAIFLYHKRQQKCQLLLPTHLSSAYSIFQAQILSNDVQLVLRQWYNEIDPFQQSIQKLTEQDWVKKYLNVRQCFRQHGSLLGNQGYGSLINSISCCIVCEILFHRSEQIMKLRKRQSHNREDQQFSFNQIVGQFIAKIDQNSPKGTSITLTNEEKLAIRQCVLSHLNPIILSKKQLKYPYAPQIYQFQKTCKNIALSTSISDQTAQTQFIISNIGFTYIHKIIFIKQIQWRQVYRIDVQHNQHNNNPYKITILYNKLEDKSIVNGDKLEIMENVNTKNGRVFMRSVLILLQRVMKTLVLEPRQKIMRYICENNLTDENIKKTKCNIEVKKYEGQTLKQVGFWDTVTNYITHNQQIQAEQSVQSLKEQRSVRSSIRKQSLEQEGEELRKTNPIKSKEEEDSKGALSDNKQMQDIKILVNKKEQKHQQESHSVQDLDMETIVKQKQKKPQKQQQKRHKSYLPPPNNDANSEIEEVITNARRSTRRELPKRRSSRQR